MTLTELARFGADASCVVARIRFRLVPAVKFDESKIEEVVLALLRAWEFENGCVWKRIDFAVMECLFAVGYITKPRGKHESVHLTEVVRWQEIQRRSTSAPAEPPRSSATGCKSVDALLTLRERTTGHVCSTLKPVAGAAIFWKLVADCGRPHHRTVPEGRRPSVTPGCASRDQ